MTKVVNAKYLLNIIELIHFFINLLINTYIDKFLKV